MSNAPPLGAVFANEPERRHFAEFLTGLLVAAKKNVSGSKAEVAATPDQSWLNRWLTAVAGDEVELNQQRLAWRQQDSHTRYAESGVIPIDHPLVDHDGQLMEAGGYFGDHAEARSKLAPDDLSANYGCPAGKPYALAFRRFRKPADCAARRAELNARAGGFDAASEKERRWATCKKHPARCAALVDGVVAQEMAGTFAFASSFTNAPVCHRLNAPSRGSVGALKFNRKVCLRGRERRVAARAAQRPLPARKKVTTGERTQGSFTKTMERPGVNHAVRVALRWPYGNSTAPAQLLATNQTQWELTRVRRGYGQRSRRD